MDAFWTLAEFQQVVVVCSQVEPQLPKTDTMYLGHISFAKGSVHMGRGVDVSCLSTEEDEA